MNDTHFSDEKKIEEIPKIKKNSNRINAYHDYHAFNPDALFCILQKFLNNMEVVLVTMRDKRLKNIQKFIIWDWRQQKLMQNREHH